MELDCYLVQALPRSIVSSGRSSVPPVVKSLVLEDITYLGFIRTGQKRYLQTIFLKEIEVLHRKFGRRALFM